MEKLDLEALQQFLNNNQGEIPKPTKGVKTLFDVMKQPHLENVWSNIYAFFFDPKEEHNLKTLFLEALTELIISKGGRDFRDMSDIRIKTEDSTTDRKRIDITIESHDRVIIIENKVYATLYNPLQSYWDKYKLPNEQKQGVVLSLYEQQIKEEYKSNWVNISHIELMQAVKCKLSNQSIPDRYRVLLTEFIQNINNMKNPIDPKIREFYNDNLNDIEKLWLISEKVKESVANEIKGLKLFVDKDGNDDTGFYEIGACRGVYLHKGKENKGRSKQHVVIAVFCNKLFSSERKITVAIELLQKDFIKSCYTNFDRLNINQSYKGNVKDIARSWAHICSVSCAVSNFEDITATVRGLIENKIDKEHSIIEIFENIEAYYDKEYKQKTKQ